jgi:hypothetical protein
MENGNQPAFATHGTYNPNNNNYNCDEQIGLTKREYFAGLAMQGLLASVSYASNYKDGAIVSQSVKIADALLEELDKPTKTK